MTRFPPDILTVLIRFPRAVCEAQAQVFAVVDGLVEKLGDVIVVQAVGDRSARACAGHQAEIAQ